MPDVKGESLDGLHERVARALELVVQEVEREYEEMGRSGEEVTLLICGHAAGIIASGRALTGRMPGDYSEEDFKCFTCGLSRFVRRDRKRVPTSSGKRQGEERAGNSRTDGGVAGGWDCLLNSSCEHLSEGEERGWHFEGDESFNSYGPAQPSATEGEGVWRVEDTNKETLDGPKL